MPGNSKPVHQCHWSQLWIPLGLVVFTLATFWPATGFDFITLDDQIYVANNAHVNTGLSWDNIRWAFTTVRGNWWLPLLWISYMFDADLFGHGPFGFHLINILLHTINVALLFWVLFRMTGARWLSAFIAAIFAVHPLRVEAVAWIASRKDVLSGLFWMLSLLAYLRYVERPTTARRWLVPFLMLLGLLSKAILIALPPVLLLLDYWPLRRAGDPLDRREWKKWGALIVEKLPLIILTLIFMAVNLNTHVTASGVLEQMPMPIRLCLIPPNYWAYLVKIAWPVRLAILYPSNNDVDGTVTAGALVGILLITFLFIGLRRRVPMLLVGWSWFLITLLPVIRGVRLGNVELADRFTYLPGIGLFILLAWAAIEYVPAVSWRKPLMAGLAAMLIAGSFTMTSRYLACWKDSETLYRHALAVTENNDLIWMNLGGAYMQMGRVEDEITCLREALKITPQSATMHVMLGTALEKKGLFEEAAWHFHQAGRFALPFESYNHAFVGERFGREGRYPEAIRHFEISLQADPNQNDTRRNLGQAYLLCGRPDKALPCFKEVLRCDPRDERAYFFMGKALLALNRSEEAVQAFRAAVELAPDKIESQNSLAVAMGQAGHMSEAVAIFKQLLKAHPESCETLNNMAWLLAANPDGAGYDPKSAKAYALKAAEQTKWQDPNILDTLAMTYAANGQFDLAVHTAKTALSIIADHPDMGESRNTIKKRMEQYQAGHPWTDKAP